MECNVEWVCIVGLGPVVNHNLLINGEKWRYRELVGAGNQPLPEMDVIKKVKNYKCDPSLLRTFNFFEGWIEKCKD